MTSAFSWQNSVSLFPAAFCIPRPNSPVTPGVSCISTFAFQPPIMKRTSFLGVGYIKSSCKREVYSDACIKKKEKFQIDNVILHLK